MIHLGLTGLIALAPVTLGIITIFGRKGKKEEEKNEKSQSTQQPPSTPMQPPPPTPLETNAPTTPTAPVQERYNAEPVSYPGETSLNQLLQSLLQDVPLTSTNSYETKDVLRESTFEWVPPLTSPPSRKMVIVEDDKGEKKLAPVQPDQPRFYAFSQASESAPEENEELTRQSLTHEQAIPPVQKSSVLAQQTSKPSKPDKPDRPEFKQRTVETSPRKEPSTYPLSEMAGGGLESPGLVLITGPQGSGKTSLVFNAAGKYLAAGTDCIFVSYDQSVSSLRDAIKNSGWDASQYESGFHLLMFDAFSGQTDSLSIEPYCIGKPFDLGELADALERNTQMMMTSKVKIIVDSITSLASRTPPKEFLAKLRTLTDKLRDLGSTFIVTVDSAKLPKDTMASFEEIATCVIELQGDGHNGGQLRVKKVNGALSKVKPEEFEIRPGKGLLFT